MLVFASSAAANVAPVPKPSTLQPPRVLLVSDQWKGSEHSSVEGIFGRGLPGAASTEVVTFTPTGATPERRGHRLILPKRCRRAGLVDALHAVNAFPADVVLVRNWYPVLRQMLAWRARVAAASGSPRVGFWLSFPHTYQRLFSAQHSGRALWRKTLEYRFRTWRETRLLRRCDCFLPITRTLRSEFHADLNVPWHPLPMGIDAEQLPPPLAERAPGPVRFAYVGTIDDLRRVDEIVAGFRGVDHPWELHVYTASDNAAVRRLRAIPEDRLHWHAPLPRRDLFAALRQADVGIGLIPEVPLYRVASPTKTVEYYALGLPALLNPLPEYRELFDDSMALYTEFGATPIAAAVQRTLAMPLEALRAMGERGRSIVGERRDYRVLAVGVMEFLRGLPPRGPGAATR